MTNGIVQETSKVAQQTISALNSVPLLLALVLLQFFILGAVMYLNIQRDKNVHERFTKLIDGCLSIQQDLNRERAPRRQSSVEPLMSPTEKVQDWTGIPPARPLACDPAGPFCAPQ